MKFSSVIISIISLTVGTAIANPTRLENRQKAPGVGDPNAQCDGKHDCCFSSEAACFRQYGTLSGNIYCPLHKYCATDYNIPRTKCRPIPSISIDKPKPLPSPPHNPLNLPNKNNMIPNPHHPLPKSPTLDHIQHPLPFQQRRLPILLNNLNPLRQPLKQPFPGTSVPPRKQIRNPRALPSLCENMHIENPAALTNRIQRPARRPDVERHQRHGLHAQAHEARHRHAPWPTRASCAGRSAVGSWVVVGGWEGSLRHVVVGVIGFEEEEEEEEEERYRGVVCIVRWCSEAEVGGFRPTGLVAMPYSFQSGSAERRLLRSLAGRRDAARSPAHELRSSHAPELSPRLPYGVARSHFAIRQSNKAINGANVIRAGRVCKFRQKKAMARGVAMKDVKSWTSLTPLVEKFLIDKKPRPRAHAELWTRAHGTPRPRPTEILVSSGRAASGQGESSQLSQHRQKLQTNSPFPRARSLRPYRTSYHFRQRQSLPTPDEPCSSSRSNLSLPSPSRILESKSAKMGKLPTHLPRPTSLLAHRPSLTTCSGTTSTTSSPRIGLPIQQSRAATFIPRPRRPYTFTQLIQLSDGSTYTVRTTSPSPLVRSAKDSRNHALWQPSDKSLKNVEVDEAGKLAAFRERFGRGFDLAAKKPTEEELNAAAAAAAPAAPTSGAAGKDAAGGKKDAAAAAAPAKEAAAPAQPAAIPEDDDIFDMGDLISGYAAMQPQQAAKEPPKKAAAPEKGKKGKK
ncbi:mitochondrial ribosomal protein [Colletotrichum fioriniae PJ7]|uniref:Mitochondrial ribosomal protein n=1 Tax=Colletotrichum fioriniae PJ7 TaxID=1445577 RepID=A0A010S0Z2_9PEZI|nr:mitochondrial ribosomal protein [Colletotrichum fioriniae PJ7]